MTAANFRALATRVFEAYEDHNYAAAFAEVSDSRPHYPDRDSDLTFWAACLLARLGETDESLTELRDGIGRGLWWSPGALEDTDLDPLRSMPGWDTVLIQCEGIAAERLAHRPEPLIRAAQHARGTVVVVQGSSARHEEVADTWQAAFPPEWTVVTPAATEPVMDGTWGWPRSIEDAAEGLMADLAEVEIEEQLVVGGFSIGSAIAAHLITTSRLPARALVVVAPGSDEDFAELRTVANKGLPLLVVGGTRDPRIAQYRSLAADLKDNPNVVVELIDGLGHAPPTDLRRRVDRFLASL